MLRTIPITALPTLPAGYQLGQPEVAQRLEDNFGRHFPYLRLSLTDVCNFRCQYCLPDGYVKGTRDNFLTLAEITRLIRVFARLGVKKVRLTGGEPTLRQDLVAIARRIATLPQISTVALTTNGYRLKSQAASFFEAGIRNLNVSIDSLDRETFHTITGHDKLQAVLAGIDEARRVGFTQIKVNAVLLKGWNDHSLPRFLDWIRREQLSVRFIELMQTGDNLDFFRARHVSADLIRQQLFDLGFSEVPRSLDAGPAQTFNHPDFVGSVGLIAPYSKDFCKSCNRLRVTSSGALMLCLFGEHGYDLRPLLQSDADEEALRRRILDALRFKHESHYLFQGNTGTTPHLASLGG